MSEIKRYKMEFAPGSGGWIKQTARGELVLFTDHEAAIEKLNVEIAGKGREIARLDAALAEKQQVLADAKARIEDLHYGDDNLLIGTGYQLAVNDALAALTQPQTERCPEDCDGFGRLIGDSDGPCPACSGLEPDRGGAATAADADLAEQVDDEWRGKVIDLADELDAEGKKDVAERVFALTLAFANTEPGPYAKAFREKFPVPEFPGIKNRQEDQA